MSCHGTFPKWWFGVTYILGNCWIHHPSVPLLPTCRPKVFLRVWLLEKRLWRKGDNSGRRQPSRDTTKHADSPWPFSFISYLHSLLLGWCRPPSPGPGEDIVQFTALKPSRLCPSPFDIFCACELAPSKESTPPTATWSKLKIRDGHPENVKVERQVLGMLFSAPNVFIFHQVFF